MNKERIDLLSANQAFLFQSQQQPFAFCPVGDSINHPPVPFFWLIQNLHTLCSVM